MCDHIDEVQEAIRRPILLENPSTYVTFCESTMSETDFIRAIVRRTGCGLLLDVNNVFVSAANHGFSALEYLSDFPLARVGEIHLAGHVEQTDDEGDLLLIDSHDGPVAERRSGSSSRSSLGDVELFPRSSSGTATFPIGRS